jgi:hypothetical protein
MFPHVGRELLEEGAFGTTSRGHGYALLLQGRSTLGTELNTAWASARGQLNAALQVSASAPSARLREVQVGMAAAAKDGARSRVWEAHAAAAAALTGQNADQGGASDQGRKRLLELNAQAAASYGWTGPKSSSGFSDMPRPTLGVFASLNRL